MQSIYVTIYETKRKIFVNYRIWWKLCWKWLKNQQNYENFKNKFEEVVANTIDKELLIPEISVDVEIDLPEITPKFFRIIQQMAPFGPQNMKPVFKICS